MNDSYDAISEEFMDICTHMDGFRETRQRISDVLTQLGDLRLGHLINLRTMYDSQAWDNVSTGIDVDAESFDREHQYYVRCNPVVPIQPHLTWKDAVFRHRDLIGEAAWSECEFVRDFTRRYDIYDGVILLLHDSQGTLRWGFGGGHVRKHGVSRKYLQLLRRLRPMLAHAVINLESWYGAHEAPPDWRVLLENVRDEVVLIAPRSLQGGPRILEATPAALRALGANTNWSRSVLVEEFIALALTAVGRSVPWMDSSGQACGLTAIRAKRANGEPDVVIVRIERALGTRAQNLLRAGLSLRELNVLQRAYEGLSDKEIGASLKISQHTVRAHLRRVYRKLGVSGRIEAMHVADRLSGPQSQGGI